MTEKGTKKDIERLKAREVSIKRTRNKLTRILRKQGRQWTGFYSTSMSRKTQNRKLKNIRAKINRLEAKGEKG